MLTADADGACPICFEPRPPATLGCGHSFCAPCLRRQLRFNAKCAFCRRTMLSSSPPLAGYGDGDGGCRRVSIDARPRGTEWGATIALARDGADGVRLKRVKRGPLRAAGVRHGARLLTINGLPCYAPEVALQTLRALVWDGGPAVLEVHERPRSARPSASARKGLSGRGRPARCLAPSRVFAWFRTCVGHGSGPERRALRPSEVLSA